VGARVFWARTYWRIKYAVLQESGVINKILSHAATSFMNEWPDPGVRKELPTEGGYRISIRRNLVMDVRRTIAAKAHLEGVSNRLRHPESRRGDFCRTCAVGRLSLPVFLSVLIALATAMSGTGIPGAQAAQLAVSGDGLPERTLELASAATEIATQSDRGAFLYRIDVSPRGNDPGHTASAVYSFYLPRRRTHIAVTFANVIVSLPPEQMEAMRHAGVLTQVQKSIDDANKPTTAELTDRNQWPVPLPLPQAKLGLREAYASARCRSYPMRQPLG
jgi:hypothetical protein